MSPHAFGSDDFHNGKRGQAKFRSVCIFHIVNENVIKDVCVWGFFFVPETLLLAWAYNIM